MKYIITSLVVASVLVFGACKKKPVRQHCYACQKYDSIHSNIAALNVVTGFENAKDTMCNYTDETIAYYMKTHDAVPDTLYKKHDTLCVQYSSIICELN